ncbi:hypothetical protein T4D_9949 [Trichinella pseudospiralis]|uniref:Uncharacterized protein n=1 Tax=Trichinella pseudospiralis TaxID=6337 RepID=A0A0V1F8S5_TRIPS|nr:hypothetical protein T4D_9949 [Trichinella pseudospiralis]
MDEITSHRMLYKCLTYAKNWLLQIKSIESVQHSAFAVVHCGIVQHLIKVKSSAKLDLGKYTLKMLLNGQSFARLGTSFSKNRTQISAFSVVIVEVVKKFARLERLALFLSCILISNAFDVIVNNFTASVLPALDASGEA